MRITHTRQPSTFVRGLILLGLGATVLVGTAGLAWSQSNTEVASATAVSVADIQSVMGAHRLEVRQCVTGDGLPMRVDIVIDFVIGIDGNVARTTLHESNAGGEVDSCVLGIIGALEFPAPTDGRTFAVRYPMIFVTGG